MIVVKVSGGLGNQMFQYAIARSISKKRKDQFKMDLLFYPAQLLRNYELASFNIFENIATVNEIKALSGSDYFIYKAARKAGLKLRPKTYFKEKKTTAFDPKVFDYSDRVYLDGFWQNEMYFIDIRREICRDFTPKEELSSQSKLYLKKIKKCNSVSIHVRRGDYVSNTHTNNVHGVCSLSYYKKAIKYIKSKEQKVVFFIFSDDINWCKDNFKFIEDKCFIDNSNSAIEDLELMKNCNHNIIANSSFSWWGGWLNLNLDKIVISPKNWIVENPRGYKWACEGWVQV
jgi:hypothetical protein